MDCEQALILISAALDGEITQSEREQLNEHLRSCADCRALADDFGLMSAAFGQEECPADLTARIAAEVARTAQNKKRSPFLRRYGSMAAMLAVVIALGAVVLSGGFNRGVEDAAFRFDAKMAAEAAPAEAAPVPSAEMQMLMDAVTPADGGASADMECVTEESRNEVVTKSESDCASGSAPLQPPESEPVQFDPPDHATISAAIKLVQRELVKEYGRNEPVETDYYYCVLERTGNEQTGAVSELKLEYAGLSENGKYLTFTLRLYTEDKGVVSTAIMNNYAVSVELDEVLREYDENRTAEHTKAYRAALSE